ncbi:MAG: phospholipid carrier-dependent glycosyltransferase [Candidatus Dormiibacterota bacterium]
MSEGGARDGDAGAEARPPRPEPSGPQPPPADESPTPEPERGSAALSAGVTPAVADPAVDPAIPIPLDDPDGDERPGFLGRLRLRRVDVLLMGAFLVVAFGFRFFSPIMPNFLTAPGQGAPVSDCVSHTPVDPQGHTGTLCGLAYPYQRSYSQPGAAAAPPNGEVFDEIYFGVFANDDLRGVTYFDPEPPVAKYVIAGGEWLTGAWRHWVKGRPGNPIDLGFNTVGWRLGVCVFGSIAVPLMYFLAMQLWRNRWFAFAAATFTCFDGLFFIESRVGVIDVIPIVFQLASLALFLVHLRARTPRDSVVTLALTGVALGLAISSKWTALAALALVAFLLIARPLAARIPIQIGSFGWRTPARPLPGGAPPGTYWLAFVLAILVLPFAIYIASWLPWYFFSSGPQQFHTFAGFLNYQWEMYYYQATLKATHPYGSKWYTWPFLIRPVAYYYQSQGLGVDAQSGQPLVAGMVNLGNPIIWWAGLPSLVFVGYELFRYRRWQAAVVLLGFFVEWLPFSLVSRVMFLYHMFGGLVFMVLALAYTVARLQEVRAVSFRGGGWHVRLARPWVVPLACAIAVVFFLYFYPVWTGLPIGQSSYLGGLGTGKMWLQSWI